MTWPAICPASGDPGEALLGTVCAAMPSQIREGVVSTERNSSCKKQLQVPVQPHLSTQPKRQRTLSQERSRSSWKFSVSLLWEPRNPGDFLVSLTVSQLYTAIVVSVRSSYSNFPALRLIWFMP